MTSIIDGDDKVILEGTGDLHSSGAYPGFVKIHKARLCPGSLGEWERIQSGTSGAEAASQVFVLIPEIFESSACLRYLGLSDAKAQQIWQEWDRADPAYKEVHSAKDVAINHIRSAGGRSRDTDSLNDQHWHDLLGIIGVNTEFQQNLMHPHYKTIRTTNTCKYWVEYFFNHRLNTLLEIRRFSAERNSPNFVTLWEGRSCNRDNGFGLDLSSWKVKDWAGFRSAARDFTTGRSQGVYFTPQRDVALHNISWHKRNDPNANYALFRVQVPKAALEGLEEGRERIELLATDQHWQHVIYSNRGSLPNICSDPGHAANVVRQALLIHGHVARGSDVIDLGTNANVLPEDQALKESREAYLNRDGKPALQYAFRIWHPNFRSFVSEAFQNHDVVYIDSKYVAEIERRWDLATGSTAI